MIKIYFIILICLFSALHSNAKGIISIESDSHIFNIKCNDNFNGKKIIYNIEIINKKTKFTQNIKVKYPPKFKYSIGGIRERDVYLKDINKDGILDLFVLRNTSDFYLYENYFCYLSNNKTEKFNILEGFENIDDVTFYRIEDSINLNNTYEKCDCKYQNKYSLVNNKIESSKISILNKVEKTYSKFEMPNKSDKKYKEFNYKIKNYTFNFILDTLYRKDTFNTHYLEVLDSNSNLIQNFKLDDLNIYFDYWIFEKEIFEIDDVVKVLDLNLDGYNDFVLTGSSWPSFTTIWKYNYSANSFLEILEFQEPANIKITNNQLKYDVSIPCGTGLPDFEKHYFEIKNGKFIFNNYEIISRKWFSEKKLYVIYKTIKCIDGIPTIIKMKKTKMTNEDFLKSEYLKR